MTFPMVVIGTLVPAETKEFHVAYQFSVLTVFILTDTQNVVNAVEICVTEQIMSTNNK